MATLYRYVGLLKAGGKYFCISGIFRLLQKGAIDLRLEMYFAKRSTLYTGKTINMLLRLLQAKENLLFNVRRDHLCNVFNYRTCQQDFCAA